QDTRSPFRTAPHRSAPAHGNRQFPGPNPPRNVGRRRRPSGGSFPPRHGPRALRGGPSRAVVMNIISKSDMQPGVTGTVVAPVAAPSLPEKAAERRSLRPLLDLVPFVARYKGRAVAALIALTVAAVATLLVPIAVRRMIDNGFDPARA